MQEDTLPNKKQTTVTPNASAQVPSHKMWFVAGAAVLCFAASFLGAWLFLATGLVQPDVSRTLNENRESIVLQEGEVVAEVFKRVSPSTVSVIGHEPSARGSLFETSRDRPGSGIVLSKDGYIITNKHVVPNGVDRATVVLHDGTELTDVTVIGRDPSNDIAFLKVNSVDDLTPAVIGDSDAITPGQKVVAIGNALGEFRNSVTTGIISGIGRPVQATDGSGSSEFLENLLQTDAAINPGNSGGPLVNLQGEVIGINTATSEQGEAISFAIPINDARGMIGSVLSQGRVIKSYLGVRYVALTPAIAEQLKLSVGHGALLRSNNGQPAVMGGSAADKAGLRDGDIITKINGQALGQSSLASRMARFSPGDKVELTIVRGGNEQVVTVTLQELPLQ